MTDSLKRGPVDEFGKSEVDFNSVGTAGTRDKIIDQVTRKGPEDGEQLLPEAPKGKQTLPKSN